MFKCQRADVPDGDSKQHLFDAAILDEHDHGAQEQLTREIDDLEPPVRLGIFRKRISKPRHVVSRESERHLREEAKRSLHSA